MAAGGSKLVTATRDGKQDLAVGDALVIAIGPEPERSAVAIVEAAGAPYTLIGDCNRPGDFLTVIRDASMVALSIGLGGRSGQVQER